VLARKDRSKFSRNYGSGRLGGKWGQIAMQPGPSMENERTRGEGIFPHWVVDKKAEQTACVAGKESKGRSSQPERQSRTTGESLSKNDPKRGNTELQEVLKVAGRDQIPCRRTWTRSRSFRGLNYATKKSCEGVRAFEESKGVIGNSYSKRLRQRFSQEGCA